MAKSKSITYDLCKSGKNYSELYDYLRSYPVYAKLMESSWFISTDKSCTDIRNEINKIIDSDDRLFIAELTGVAAWKNLLCDVGNPNYLKEHL